MHNEELWKKIFHIWSRMVYLIIKCTKIPSTYRLGVGLPVFGDLSWNTQNDF